MATITFDKVRKVYPLPSHPTSLFHRRKDKDEGEVVAVKDFSMEIKDNEFVVLVGPQDRLLLFRELRCILPDRSRDCRFLHGSL